MHAPRNALVTATALVALVAGCSSGEPTATPATSGPAAEAPASTTAAASATVPAATTSPAPATTTTVASPATTAATTAATTSATAPTSRLTCGVDLRAGAVTAAVVRLRPAFTDPANSHPWARTADGGNYDPCATLSAASVTIEGATGSSPEQVLLFHHGVYQGTGTLRAHGFTTIDVAASNDDTVVVDYGYEKPGESTASASGHVTIRYRWVDRAVRMIGTLPPEITR